MLFFKCPQVNHILLPSLPFSQSIQRNPPPFYPLVCIEQYTQTHFSIPHSYLLYAGGSHIIK